MHEKIDAASRARAKPYEDKRHIESQKPTTACGFSENYLRNINIDYAEHYIRKKTGGYRKICSPNWALKAAQTQILHRIIYTERTHPYSFGFRKYKSIVDNARPHCDSAVVIKLDIENFFPSIKKDNVHAIFQVMGWSDQHSSILSNLCCWEGCLPQGAPTSPALSNIFLREFDEKLAKFAIRNKARYTRYADDMMFSLQEDSSKKFEPSAAISINKSVALLSTQKGPHSLDKNVGFSALTGFLVKPGLDELERGDWILRGPSCMGGEFLPALDTGHVEIASVSMASTTSDQVSIRALREVDHIRYSIVGEYEDEEGMSYDLPFETSKSPLSMQELLAFMDGATYQNDLYPGGILSSSWFMMHEFGHDDVAGVSEFLSLSSPFYPDIDACYLQAAADWLADKQRQDADAMYQEN